MDDASIFSSWLFMIISAIGLFKWRKNPQLNFQPKFLFSVSNLILVWPSRWLDEFIRLASRRGAGCNWQVSRRGVKEYLAGHQTRPGGVADWSADTVGRCSCLVNRPRHEGSHPLPLARRRAMRHLPHQVITTDQIPQSPCFEPLKLIPILYWLSLQWLTFEATESLTKI